LARFLPLKGLRGLAPLTDEKPYETPNQGDETMTYRDETDIIFGRRNENGNIALLYEADGAPVTRLDEDIYPIDSDLSARHEHPEGIVIDDNDAVRLGIEIED
jgi:hypothetical protein